MDFDDFEDNDPDTLVDSQGQEDFMDLDDFDNTHQESQDSDGSVVGATEGEVLAACAW